ncbi:MAG: yapH [Phycisphaerales bacterium]|nr:yapH [Phycisphaerales bacterium]
MLSAAAGAVVIALWPQWIRAGVAVVWDANPSVAGIQGGNGTWNTSSSNWDNAGVSGPWFNARGDTALFSGTPGGVVQLAVPITADGLRFDAAGYTIGGASSPVLTLNSGSIVANVDASIVAPLSTLAGLIKSGAGTVTLLAANTIRANVTILGGAVSFSTEPQLGVTAHPIELSGGGLRYGGAAALTLSAARTLIIDADGGRIDLPTAGMTFNTAGQLSGVGTLTKLGAQSLTISVANTAFAGAMNVAVGALVLQNAGALNGRPITLSGGGLSLRGDQTNAFQSDVTVTGDSIMDIDRLTVAGITGGFHSLGDLSLAAGGKLTVNGDHRNYVSIRNLSLAGALRINDSAVMVKGTFTGGGTLTFGPGTQAPELFTSGLIFANGAPQTITNPVMADDAAAGRPIIAVGAATKVTYNGPWAGGGANATSTVVLRDGATFVAGPAARLNTTTADVTGVRPFIAIGNGAANTFELDAAFVADHTASGTVADGFSSLEARDATLVTRATQSLPVVIKKDSFGGTHRAGNLTFSGTNGTRWTVATADQQFDGAVTFNASATIQADHDLTHIGSVAKKFDGQFQMPVAAVMVTKQGAGWLNLSAAQGYVAGSKLLVQGGGVRFNTDPGAGWYAGNFTRGADGNITVAPTPAATLSVIAGGSAGAAVEFAAPVSRVDALQVNAGGSARVTAGMLIVRSLSATGGGQLDLGNNRLVVDYDGSASSLADIAAMIKSGFNVAGAHWQAGGIVSSVAAANPAMGVGYAEAADVLRIAGAQNATFGGQTVDATSVLVRLTRLGDADLDGEVGFGDFQRFERGFGLTGQTWSGGDFNYDGKVDIADFKLLFSNYGLTADLAGADPVGVPEPGALWIIGPTGLMFLRRRRFARARDRGAMA